LQAPLSHCAAAQEAGRALAGGEAADAFGGVLVPRAGGAAAGDAAAPAARADARTQELLDAYFGADDQLPAGERFLKGFIRNKVAPPRSGGPAFRLAGVAIKPPHVRELRVEEPRDVLPAGGS
jgi:hypothetical protein